MYLLHYTLLKKNFNKNLINYSKKRLRNKDIKYYYLKKNQND